MKTAALEKAITAVGGLTELAHRLKVSPQVIQNWRTRGVPAQRVLEVERATVMEEGSEPRVTRFDLRPDLYPPEERAAA
jgi:DNA-binding transcriptional regulator YdaS (Cro superfamily)